jgi:hypothetical protein
MNNIAMDLNITNRVRGVIVNIILNPKEPLLGGDTVVPLSHLSLCVLVKLTHTHADCLDGLESRVIPIPPAKSTMQIVLDRKTKTMT